MTGGALPTRENPRHIGRHQLYYYAGEVLVIVYSGDLEADEMRVIISCVVEARKRVLATVADVGDLGSFGPATRKVLLAESVTEILMSETAPIGVFVVNADVVRRAVMKLATLAARLLSKRAQRVFFLKSRDEAEVRAAVYHAKFASAAKRPPSGVER